MSEISDTAPNKKSKMATINFWYFYVATKWWNFELGSGSKNP